jgi:hypothetical protein
MAEYTLTNSAAVVDASIQKVANADTTPVDASPNMITSGGVKAYVDAQDTTLEAQVLANTTAIANSGLKAATLSAANGYKGIYDSNLYIPFTEQSDPDNLISVSSGNIKLQSAGTYLISIEGSLQEADSDGNDYWVVQVKKGSSVQRELIVNEGTSELNYVQVSFVANTTTTFSVTFFRSSRPSALSWSRFKMSVVKLA